MGVEKTIVSAKGETARAAAGMMCKTQTMLDCAGLVRMCHDDCNAFRSKKMLRHTHADENAFIDT